MSFKIKKLSYKNLKYVGKEETQLEFSNNLTLLDGPNGYGKSTVYDAVELLLTGKMERNANGKLSSMANNNQSDIVIKGVLENDNIIIQLERVILAQEGFKSDKITWNDNVINQNQLYDNLRLKESAIGVAVYVSQLKSLNYLEKKGKDRRLAVVELIDDSKIKDKLTYLQTFKKTLSQKFEKDINDIRENSKKEEEKQTKLTTQINNINKIQGKKGYARLFDSQAYEFDKEHLDKNIDFSDMVKPLEEIRDFLQNYHKYEATKEYELIEDVLHLDNNLLKSFFYQKQIAVIRDNLKLYKDIESLEKLTKESKIEYISEINELLQKGVEEKAAIEAIIERYNTLRNAADSNKSNIIKLAENRKHLFDTYQNSVASGIWRSNVCPLCGKDSENLEQLFLDTEKTLSDNNKIVLNDLNKVKMDINQYFKDSAAAVTHMIEENEKGYKTYLEVKDILLLNLKEEEKGILKRKHFEYSSSNHENTFEKSVMKLKKELEEEKGNYKELLGKDVLERYKNIEKKYYSGTERHTAEQVADKIAYIADCYGDDYLKELEECDVRLAKLKMELSKKQVEQDRMELYTDTYVEKYKKALDIYQTKLVQQIKVPLYIYSGKVIQNYPMGLGVIARIKSSSIVFETEKKEEDVFEYLSAGQLNGVMLSVMLAVRSVMDFKQSLNVIMIDDPLQTIDDVSAFSYADLLAGQFDDAQMILSTHEMDKSDLLEFKFRQHEREVIKYNMHDRYLMSR